MSDKEFENYVALIGKLLQLRRDERELIAQELQDHLQMRIADLKSDGVSREAAVSQALEEFGDAAVMAKNFQTVLELKRRRWVMRFATLSIAGVFLVAILAMAMWPGDARFGAPGTGLAQGNGAGDTAAPVEEAAEPNEQTAVSDATHRDILAERRLREPIDLDFTETPVSEILFELRDRTGLNFLLHTSAKDDSLTEDEPITFHLVGMPLDKSLQLMLDGKNATYAIDEGVVLLISKDDASSPEFQRVKMFDCRKLVNVLPDSSVGPPSGGGFGGGGLDGGGGGVGGGFFMVQAALPQDVEKPASAPVQNQLGNSPDHTQQLLQQFMMGQSNSETTGEHTLINLVHTMVTPEDWEHVGGGARAEVVDGILVVSHSEAGLRKVEHLVEDLEGLLLDKKVARTKLRLPPRRVPKHQNSNVGKTSSDAPKSKAKKGSTDPFGNPTKASGSGSSNPFGSDPFGG